MDGWLPYELVARAVSAAVDAVGGGIDDGMELGTAGEVL